jgi:hypothetical protein
MNGMNQTVVSSLDAGRECQAKNIFRDRLEGLDQNSKVHFGREMLVAYHDHCASFWTLVHCKLITVANCAHIAGVRMKKIYRPAFCLPSVVPKRPSNLELDCPFVRDQEIRVSLRTDGAAVLRNLIQMSGNELDQLRLSKGSNAWLKCAEAFA